MLQSRFIFSRQSEPLEMKRPGSTHLFQAESAFVHNHFAFHCDSGIFDDAIDVGLAVPFCAGLGGYGAAERNMHAGELLILK